MKIRTLLTVCGAAALLGGCVAETGPSPAYSSTGPYTATQTTYYAPQPVAPAAVVYTTAPSQPVYTEQRTTYRAAPYPIYTPYGAPRDAYDGNSSQ